MLLLLAQPSNLGLFGGHWAVRCHWGAMNNRGKWPGPTHIHVGQGKKTRPTVHFSGAEPSAMCFTSFLTTLLLHLLFFGPGFSFYTFRFRTHSFLLIRWRIMKGSWQLGNLAANLTYIANTGIAHVEMDRGVPPSGNRPRLPRRLETAEWRVCTWQGARAGLENVFEFSTYPCWWPFREPGCQNSG